MSYQKLNLQNGQVLDAEHLAHMEDALDKAVSDISVNAEEIDKLSKNIISNETIDAICVRKS